MPANPLCNLHEHGQSPWLDLLSRTLLNSGRLGQLIETDCISGVTSNPAIFDCAISGSDDYLADIRKFADQGMTSLEIYQRLAISDVQDAADLFRPVYERTHGIYGYVSLEVSPKLARDTVETVHETNLLWAAVDRPNAMIKIPGTQEGLGAIEHCIAEGININVTLLFGVPRYQDVAEAYLRGMERRAKRHQSLMHVRSVASFFVSRIDVLVDQKLEEISLSDSRHAKELLPLSSCDVSLVFCARLSAWSA